jgi:Arm DNA-binding domain
VAKRTLNDRILKTLKPAKAGSRYEVMDSIVPGFGIRVTESGQKTFVLVARFPGSTNPTRRALGEYGALNLEKARQKARSWLEMLRRGIDPREEEERLRAAELRQRRNTFAAVAEDFIKDKLPGERKGREAERDIRREFIPVWGKRPIAEIVPHDVRAVIRPRRIAAHRIRLTIFSFSPAACFRGQSTSTFTAWKRHPATGSSRNRSSARKTPANAFSITTNCALCGRRVSISATHTARYSAC